VRLVVVAVADVGGGDEELKGVVLFDVEFTDFDLVLDGLHALLAVGGEAELFLVAPEDGGTRLYGGLGEHVVEDDALVAAFVAYYDEE